MGYLPYRALRGGGGHGVPPGAGRDDDEKQRGLTVGRPSGSERQIAIATILDEDLVGREREKIYNSKLSPIAGTIDSTPSLSFIF